LQKYPISSIPGFHLEFGAAFYVTNESKGVEWGKMYKKNLQKRVFGLFDTSAGSAYYSIVRKNSGEYAC